MPHIDPDFKSSCKPVSTFGNITIWKREGQNSDNLGIYGTDVAVDFDLCIGDGACIEVCPVNVFEWYDGISGQSPGDRQRKAAPVRERDCIYCMGCEAVCPKFAIRVSPLAVK